jgi:competence protein ComEC
MEEQKSPIEKVIEFINHEKRRNIFITFLIGCFFFNVVWVVMYFESNKNNAAVYFLDVGQGDSELIIFPSGAKMLIDGGPPNGKVETEISRIIGPFDRYIDLIILTHPQTDHFGGLVGLSKNYKFGAFFTNGERSDIDGYVSLKENLEERGVRHTQIYAGDIIKQGETIFRVFSPQIPKEGESIDHKDENDRAILGKLSMGDGNILFTADIGKSIEDAFAPLLGYIDVLKVAHHGSKYSSGERFISFTKPKIAIIEVGKNSYGHPAPEITKRLFENGATVYRTDTHGTIKVEFKDGFMRAYTLSDS